MTRVMELHSALSMAVLAPVAMEEFIAILSSSEMSNPSVTIDDTTSMSSASSSTWRAGLL